MQLESPGDLDVESSGVFSDMAVIGPMGMRGKDELAS